MVYTSFMSQKNVLELIFFTGIFFLFLLPHADNDFGWHVRCGEQLLFEQRPCVKNEFTYFLPNFEWANPNFVYDAFLALIFRGFGFVGVSVAGALVFTLAIHFVYKASREPAVAVSSAIFLSWSIFDLGFRSQIVSFLFVFITLWVLLKAKSLWILIPIFWLWGNIHSGFFLGVLVFGLFVIAQFYEFLRGKCDFATFAKTCAIFIAASAATLFNPFGWRIYEEVYRHWQIPMHTLIAEWIPPATMHIVLILLLDFIYIAFLLVRRRLPLFDILVLAVFSYFAILARRNLPLFYFSYATLFPRIDFPWKRGEAVLIPLLAPGVLLLAVIRVVSVLSFDYCNDGYVPMPCAASSFMDGKVGNLYNRYEWGGYLVWRLPKMKMFVDGRMPAWTDERGKSAYTAWLEILQTQEGWNNRLAELHTDYLMISPDTFLDLLLKKQAEEFSYREIYRDGVAVVYERLKY